MHLSGIRSARPTGRVLSPRTPKARGGLLLGGPPAGQFLCGQVLCGCESIGRRDSYIRFDPDAFPIGLGRWIDGARKRNPDRESIVNAMASHRMRAAAGHFADKRRALQHFEIV